MKLEGSLDAFGLPDIFQLLSFTKKTGGLHLSSGAGRGLVYFAAGAITGASADIGRLTLVRRLVGSGTVSDASLDGAVSRAQAEGVSVMRALIDSDAVDADLIRQAATEQAVDAVYDLLRWSAGDFAFSVDEANPDEIGLQLPTERVVAEAQSRTTAYEQALELVPADSVLVMPVVLVDDPELTRDEWALVALVDGRRTVSDLVDLTGAGLFAVLSTLAELVRRGLLTVIDPELDHASAVRRRLELLLPLESQAPGTLPDLASIAESADSAIDGGNESPADAEEPLLTPATGGTGSGKSATGLNGSAGRNSLGAPPRSGFGIGGIGSNGSNGSIGSSASGGSNGSGSTAQPREADSPAATAAAADHQAPAAAAVVQPARTAPPAQSAQPAQTAPRDPRPAPLADSPSSAGSASPSASPTSPAPTRAPSAAAAAEAPSEATPVARLGLAPDPFRSAERPAANGSRQSVGADSHPQTLHSAQASPAVVNGSSAVAAQASPSAVIERDPSVNRSLLLRLIAGVRGL